MKLAKTSLRVNSLVRDIYDQLIREKNLKNRQELQIRINVRDRGIRIPEDKQNIIFEWFQQADDTYTRKYGGTGLGLAISKQITEFLGGKIWMESKYRQYERFGSHQNDQEPGPGVTHHSTDRICFC